MKRNRVKYIVYLEPWSPGQHVVVYSKYQMKKVLKNANSGSVAHKCRLLWSRDGSCSFWNADHRYDDWVKS
jgi:hypothetical protein